MTDLASGGFVAYLIYTGFCALLHTMYGIDPLAAIVAIYAAQAGITAFGYGIAGGGIRYTPRESVTSKVLAGIFLPNRQMAWLLDDIGLLPFKDNAETVFTWMFLIVGFAPITFLVCLVFNLPIETAFKAGGGVVLAQGVLALIAAFNPSNYDVGNPRVPLMGR